VIRSRTVRSAAPSPTSCGVACASSRARWCAGGFPNPMMFRSSRSASCGAGS